MINNFITEISEEDFRKLDIKVKCNERVVVSENIPGHPVCKFEMVEKSFNEMLDNALLSLFEGGYEEDYEMLKYPVTLALCVDGEFYLDKWLNRFTGMQNFQEGFGIKHIYVTRDYYEAKDGVYWKVPKKITKAIYRIHLDEKWINSFKLKHKTEIVKVIDDKSFVKAHYNLVDNEWIEVGKTLITKDGERTTIKKYDE